MNRDTKFWITESIILFALSIAVQQALLALARETFDSCVIHVCGCTTGDPFQSMLYLLFHLPPFFALWYICHSFMVTFGTKK